MNKAPRIVHPSGGLGNQIEDLEIWMGGKDMPVEVKYGGTVFYADSQEVIREGKNGTEGFTKYCRDKIDACNSGNSYIAPIKREKRPRIRVSPPIAGSSFRPFVKGR